EIAVARPARASGREPRPRSPRPRPGAHGRALADHRQYRSHDRRVLLDDAGDYYCDMTSSDAAEAVIGDLQGVGIRAKLRPLERAAFNKSVSEKKLRG